MTVDSSGMMYLCVRCLEEKYESWEMAKRLIHMVTLVPCHLDPIQASFILPSLQLFTQTMQDKILHAALTAVIAGCQVQALLAMWILSLLALGSVCHHQARVG